MKLWVSQNNQGGRRVVLTATALLFERVVRVIVGLGVSALVARHLGPGVFGALSYGLALGTIGAGIAQLGMDSILVREFARRPDEAGRLLITSAIMRFAVAGLSAVANVAIFFFWLSGRDGSPPIAIVGILSLTAFQAVSSTPTFWMQTQGRAWQSTAGLLPIFLTAAVVRVLLVWGGASVVGFGWVAVAEVVASGVVSFFQVRRAVAGVWSFSRRVARDLIAASWPLGLAALAFLGYTRMDQILLSELAGEKELGIYVVALRLTELGYLLPAVLATPMLGLIAAADGEGPALRRHLERYAAISVIISYGFVLVVCVAAPVIFRTFFGHQYEAATAMARIQAWAAPFIAVGYARNQILIAEGRTKFALLAAIAGMVVNVALNLLLIPRWGGVGASWAGLAAQFVSLVASSWCHPSLQWLARIQVGALFKPWRAWATPSLPSA